MSRLPSLAARNVSRNRRRSAVTLAAILIGVALIILLRGFTQGAATLMVEDVVLGRTGALQVHRAGYLANVESNPTELSIPYTPEVLSRIESVPGVVGVAGRIQFNGLVSNGRSQTMFVGRGMDPRRERQACPRAGALVKPGGEPLAEGDRAHALLGYELGKSFGVSTVAEKRASGADGERRVDFVTLQTSSPEGRANAMDVRVKGMTASSLPFENKRVVTLPLATAQELLGMEGRVTEYAVAVAELSKLDRVAGDLRRALGPEYEVHTWRELQPFVRDVIARHDIIIGGIAVVLFVVVLTTIVNTMLMSVFERVREIGTMLAVGVRRRQVLALFVLEAGLLGAVGGAAGALLGRAALLGFAWRGIPIQLAGTSGHALLRPEVTAEFTFWAVVGAAAAALVAAAYPAWRASRLDPVEALRSV